MKASPGLLAAVVIFTSVPAFAHHRHHFFWHYPVAGVVPLPIPLPLPPMVVPVPVPVPAPVMVAEVEPLPPVVTTEPVYVAPAPLPPVVEVPPAPTPVYVPPPPPAPVYYAPAPVVVAAPVVRDEESVQRLAVKWMPGLSAPLSWEDKAFGNPQFTNNFGVEFRISRYFAIRGDLELRDGARSWEIPGLKVSLFPSSRLHPFASASLSVNQSDAAGNKVSLGFMGAAGLDLTLFKYFFLTAEARYNTVPGNCCALPRVTGLVGAGVQFL